MCLECKAKGKECIYPQPKKRGRAVGSKNKVSRKKNSIPDLANVDLDQNQHLNQTFEIIDVKMDEKSSVGELKRTGTYHSWFFSQKKRKGDTKKNNNLESTCSPKLSHSSSSPSINSSFPSNSIVNITSQPSTVNYQLTSTQTQFSQDFSNQDLIQLVNRAINVNSNPSQLDVLMKLIVQNSNASQITPTINSLLSQSHGISVDVVRNSFERLPTVVDNAILTTFERNTTLNQVLLQQQTLDLFLRVVSNGLHVQTEKIFKQILYEKEKYGTQSQYLSLLYSVQCFCNQRFGNKDALRAYHKSKELLFQEYDFLKSPSFIIAYTCSFLAAYAAGSYMNNDALELIRIGMNYLRTAPPEQEGRIFLQRSFTISQIVIQDNDYETSNDPYQIGVRLTDSYKFCSRNTIPQDLEEIGKKPCNAQTADEYLYFLDRLSEAYYLAEVKGTTQFIFPKLLYQLVIRCFKIAILRKAGQRGRQLKTVASEITALTTNKHFGLVSPFLLAGLSYSWRTHLEAIEEIEEEFNKGLPVNKTEFTYFQDMLNHDLNAANVLGQRFSKVLICFGDLIQRMMACSKRRTNISQLQPLNLSIDISSIIESQLLHSNFE